MTAGVRLSVVAAGVFALACVALVIAVKSPECEDSGCLAPASVGTEATADDISSDSVGVAASEDEPRESEEENTSSATEEEEPPISEEERLEREEAALVDAFDALTDRWMEPADDGVSMEDVDEFSRQFEKVPPDHREDCLRRALNLIPDENVMLLAGVLMDKSLDRELVELAYNDVLNRDEDVKHPILLEIFKDKSHPCWTDTAWILDVTDQTPEK